MNLEVIHVEILHIAQSWFTVLTLHYNYENTFPQLSQT